jgi:peptidoglycan/LPS O-acetylase OafA/YrhL
MMALPSNKLTEGRLRELDGWRAISVLLVIAHHLGAFQYGHIVAPHLRSAAVFSNIGPLGVKVFFVISGFVICRLLILEEKRNSNVSLKGFYIRRVFRILPPLYLYLAVLGLLLAFGLIHETWSGICSSAFFLYDFVPAMRGGWGVGHTWSLAVEEQFYLTFPILWVLTRKLGRGRVFLGIFCLLAAWNLWAAMANWNQITVPSTRAGYACICWGVVLASFETRARAVGRKIPSLVAAALSLILLWHPVGFSTWRSALYESVYMPLAIGTVLVFSLECTLWFRTVLCWKPVQAIGLSSYGIYLWQQLFTGPAEFYTATGKPIQFFLQLLLVIVPLSYFFVERPLMRLGRSLANRVRPDRVREMAYAQDRPIAQLP